MPIAIMLMGDPIGLPPIGNAPGGRGPRGGCIIGPLIAGWLAKFIPPAALTPAAVAHVAGFTPGGNAKPLAA
jgi:hypothetical protein